MKKIDLFVFSCFALLALASTLLLQGCSGTTTIANDWKGIFSSQEENLTSYERARKAFADGQLSAALQEVEQGLQKSANDENLLVLKADIESYDCQFEKAIADYSKAISCGASSAAYAARGEAYLRLGKFSQARSDIQEAFKSPGGTNYGGLLLELNNIEYDSQHPLKDPAKLWAIACTSSLYTNRGNGNNSLYGAVPSEDLAKGQRQVLTKFWGINSRKQLLAMLKRLVHDFDNRRWQEMRRLQDTPAFLLQFRAGWGLQEDYDHAIKLLREHSSEYGDRGIQAWDFCRYMNVCRAGYQAKYLSEDETWALMMPMAARIQTLAKSWAQLESEYLVGYSFWSRSAFASDEWHYMRNVNRLLKDPNSPWVKLPWNTKLDSKFDDEAIYKAIDKVSENQEP